MTPHGRAILTESWIRQHAERYGLQVLKRITTGTEAKGFATFELSGHPERVRDAWPEVQGNDWPQTHGKGYAASARIRRSDADGAAYIEITSVWFEVATP